MQNQPPRGYIVCDAPALPLTPRVHCVQAMSKTMYPESALYALLQHNRPPLVHIQPYSMYMYWLPEKSNPQKNLLSLQLHESNRSTSAD
ncbi:MAG: hypothetical protein RH948_12555 [Cyclobacteriaceae bacterium]